MKHLVVSFKGSIKKNKRVVLRRRIGWKIFSLWLQRAQRQPQRKNPEQKTCLLADRLKTASKNKLVTERITSGNQRNIILLLYYESPSRIHQEGDCCKEAKQKTCRR